MKLLHLTEALLLCQSFEVSVACPIAVCLMDQGFENVKIDVRNIWIGSIAYEMSEPLQKQAYEFMFNNRFALGTYFAEKCGPP